MAQARETFTYYVKTLRRFYVERKNFGLFFHSVEKSFPRYVKTALAAGAAIGLAGGAAGCASVKASRLAIPKTVHWTVTASAAEDGHGPDRAADGITETGWRNKTEDPQ